MEKLTELIGHSQGHKISLYSLTTSEPPERRLLIVFRTIVARVYDNSKVYSIQNSLCVNRSSQNFPHLALINLRIYFYRGERSKASGFEQNAADREITEAIWGCEWPLSL
jgi:hypothetical protein